MQFYGPKVKEKGTMRLKSIEMQGFKSFADKIYLDFNPGITAIVGPNGSGKSNISDAIRWVMGEQSVKSLRGSKMEDVIFAGTEARKALGFAEVTLVLDNSDGFFSLDFPEITVTRRVYRSGEGEYYINKTLCRLKDIHELFMDTGLGRDGYSIIGQGKIDSVLSTKSEDRRQIFEEAAGISKYKYRKIEAERKLLQTSDNLTRVEDILTELGGQLGPLERQSEKARRYLLLRDEMRGLDITVSVINAEKAKAALKELNSNIALLAEQIAGMKAELTDSETEIGKMYDALKEYDAQTESYRESDQKTVSLIHEQKNRISLLTNDMEHNSQDITRLEEEIAAGKEEANRLDNLLIEHKETLDALNTKNLGTGKSLDALTEESKKTDRDASEKNSVLESMKAEVVELTAKINALHAGIENLHVLTENFSQRKTAIEKERSGRAKDKNEYLSEYEENLRNHDASVLQMERCKQTAEKLAEEISRSEAALKKLEDAKNQGLLRLGQQKSRRSMLMDMEREYEGYAKGVRGVMTAYQKGAIPNATIYGPLAQLIKTEQVYITAIETALGAANQNIVTKSEEDAKAAISYLKSRHLGRATFLPISAMKPKHFTDSAAKNAPGFVAVAADLVQCDHAYRDIVSYFLGNTVICEKMEDAIAMARKSGHRFRIVTLDGDVIQAGGAMTGGSALKTTGSLSRTGEIKSLNDAILKGEKAVKEYENEHQKLMEKQRTLQQAIRENTEKTQALQGELIRLKSNLSHNKSLLDGLEAGEKQLNTEFESIVNRLSDIQDDKLAKEKEIAACTARCGELEKQIAFVQKEYSELSGKNEQLVSKLTELNLSRNTIQKDMEMQNDRISRLTTEKSQVLLAVTAKSEGILQIRERNHAMQTEIEALGADTAAKEKLLSDYRQKLDLLSNERTQKEETIRIRQQALKESQEQIFGLTQQQERMENRAERYENEIEGIVTRLLEEYELPYSEAAAMKAADDFDYSTASARIKTLKEQIRALGNINIDAIEEYKDVKERFDFLTEQTKDLEKAKKELERVIDEMLTIMQKRFAEQFQIINRNFNRVFAALFGGGRANLTMTDPENILESGIEIEAQPPGKKLQSLTLLSGGERAFTAIALLFAILDVRPTPFCILDEIEAALDDVNVYRYADYLSHYSDKTQFIVVTHRRGTMEAANILYGVTMQERGISKLLSLNIDDIQQEKES